MAGAGRAVGAPQPFPYQGSKRALADAVLRHLPGTTRTLVEPFAGSAAVSIAARHRGRAPGIVLGDVNAPLMSLWGRILHDPAGLAADYERMWHEAGADPRSYFARVRRDFNEAPTPAALLYLLNRIVKGAVRYSRSGEFNQAADHRRLGARPDVVARRLQRTSALLTGTELHVGSYERLLVGAASDDVVYLDPPYQGVSGAADPRYVAGLSRPSFERALHDANANGVSYLVSYDAVRDDDKYGPRLDDTLGLTHLHLEAGRSAQATLGGGTGVTTESLYLSPALARRLGARTTVGA